MVGGIQSPRVYRTEKILGGTVSRIVGLQGRTWTCQSATIVPGVRELGAPTTERGLAFETWLANTNYARADRKIKSGGLRVHDEEKSSRQ